MGKDMIITSNQTLMRLFYVIDYTFHSIYLEHARNDDKLLRE